MCQRIMQDDITIFELIELLEIKAETVSKYIIGCVSNFYDKYDGRIDEFPIHEVFSDIAIIDGFNPDLDFREQKCKNSLTGRRGIYVFILKEDTSLT